MPQKRAHHAATVVVLALGYLAGTPVFVKPVPPFLTIALVARVMVAFGLPMTATVIYLLFRSLWQHDRVRTGNGAFEATYAAIVFRVVVFVTMLHGFVVAVLMGLAADRVVMSRAVVFVFGALFVAIGNLLPQTRPNVALGLRTARTLSNAQSWQQVHRAGGYAAVGFGVVTAVTSLMLTNSGTGAAIISAAAGIGIATVFISYRRSAGV
jgi:hypothetical protein